MSCSFPVYRIPAQHLPRWVNPKFIYNDGLMVGINELDYWRGVVGDECIQPLRCGRCADCRLHKSLEWSIRCSHEASLHPINYFVTLTYDNEHLPKGEFIDFVTGELKEDSLCLKDCQDFLKRLRTNCKRKFNHEGVRVFYSGEYGDLYDRPHYHMLLFNMPDLSADLSFKETRSSDHLVYDVWDSPFLSETWSKGIIEVGEVNFLTAAYTSKYVFKKQVGDNYNRAKLLAPLSGLPLRSNPFSNQSRRPGIARAFIELNADDIYSSDTVYYQKNFEAYKAKPPRYYDKIFDSINPDQMLSVKDRRIELGLLNQRSCKSYSESFEERLKREDRMLNDRLSKRYDSF